MTWVSERQLVAAISNAGGFGVIASGSMGPEMLASEIAATSELTGQPFGVNLIVMHPQLEQLARRLPRRRGRPCRAGGRLAAAETMAAAEGGRRQGDVLRAPLALAKKLVRSAPTRW